MSITSKALAGSENQRLAKLKYRRKLWLQIHLNLGLFAGAILVIIGLTGSMLVFWQEIDALLNPKLMKVSAPREGVAAYKPLDEIIAAAQTAIPEGSKVFFCFYPHNQDAAFKINYLLPSATITGAADEYNVFVNPYTAQVTGIRLWQRTGALIEGSLVSFIFRLHDSLLLKNFGILIVGILGVLLIFSVLTGLIVWWPLNGNFKQALTIKSSAGFTRLVFDLHKTAGIYSAIILLSVLLSGVYMNLPDQFKTVVNIFSPLTETHLFKSEPGTGQKLLTIGAAVEIAEKQFSGGEIKSVKLPIGPTDIFRIDKTNVKDVGQFVKTRSITLDQYSGKILNVLDPETGTGGDVFLQWQWPLHSGQAFGWTGRILVFLAGLACPVLYVTGVIRWLQKRRAKRGRLG